MHGPANIPMLLEQLAPMAMSRPAAAAGTAAAHHLAELATQSTTAVEADQLAQACLLEPLHRLTRGGWRIAEIERVVALRAASPASVSVLADLVSLDADADDPGRWWRDDCWFASVVTRGAEPTAGVVAVAAVWSVLTSISPLPLFVVSDDRDLDRGLLRKVRALLAKAESTDFPAESDALTAKAQDLITRHALDGLGVDPGQRTEVRSRRIPLDVPYASAKAILLARVAAANRCQSVQCTFTQTSTVIGVPADLSAVEVLYTSLLTQATTAMLSAGSVEDRRGRNRTKSFRRSFLLGFAQRIGERLRATTAAAVDASDSPSLLPALRARSAAVDEAVRDAFPALQKRQVGHSNVAGFGAGDRAGASADLGGVRVRGPGGSLSA